jgi:hypothetical protein
MTEQNAIHEIIARMSLPEREKIQEASAKIINIVKEYESCGFLALALTSTEVAENVARESKTADA